MVGELRKFCVRVLVAALFMQSAMIHTVQAADRGEPDQTMAQSLFSSPPLGGIQSSGRADCDPSQLDLIFADDSVSAQVRMDRLGAFFLRCESDLGSPLTSAMSGLIADYLMKYDFAKNPRVQPIAIQAGGLAIKGYLAVQPDLRPRPLVIAQCGMGCDPTGFALAGMLMFLFDEGKFNVLLIPSSTGPEFQIANGEFLLGGFEEGRILQLVARAARSPQFPIIGGKVASVHVVGLSLGGHSALYSGLFDSLESSQLNQPRAIDGVIAACPVVDLGDAIRSLLSTSEVSGTFYDSISSNLSKTRPYVPTVQRVFGDGIPAKRELPDFIAAAAIDGYLSRAQKTDEFRNPEKILGVDRILSAEELYKANSFFAFASRANFPLTVVAAENDPVVDTQTQSGKLKQLMSGNSQASFLILPSGGHCNYHRAYGWAPFGRAFRKIVESQAPASARFKTKRTRVSARFDSISTRAVNSLSEYSFKGMHWEVKPNESKVHLVHEFQLKKGASRRGSQFDRVRGQSEMDRTAFGQLLGPIPATEVEAQAETRKLNATARLLFSTSFGDLRTGQEVTLELEEVE